MLLVKTRLGPSAIQGLGLFADEFIPKGTLVQQFIPSLDLEIAPEIIEQLPDKARREMLHFCYKHKKTGNYILCADNARFLNHSESPSLTGGGSSEEIDIAFRDIQKGEELTVNYYEFDADAASKLSLT